MKLTAEMIRDVIKYHLRDVWIACDDRTLAASDGMLDRAAAEILAMHERVVRCEFTKGRDVGFEQGLHCARAEKSHER